MADDKTFTKAELDSAIKDAIEEATKGLKKNLDDALDEAKEAKRKLRSASEIKPEDLTAAEDRADKAEARVKELEKTAKDAVTAREKAEKALADEQGYTQKLLISDGLKSALIANGVKDEDFIDSLTAKFAANAKVIVEGDQRKAMLGDKPMMDAIKEWAGSDAGKKFVAAATNSGGGAGGGDKNKGSAAKTMLRSTYAALDQNAKAELGPEMAKGELKLVDDSA